MATTESSNPATLNCKFDPTAQNPCTKPKVDHEDPIVIDSSNDEVKVALQWVNIGNITFNNNVDKEIVISQWWRSQ